MVKVGIIGYGYIGRALAGFFEQKYEVNIYDPYVNPPRGLGSQEEINKCDLAVICVPTPMSKDGKCDTSIVEKAINWIQCPLILIKSTIPPGTTYDLIDKCGKDIVFSPEFCGEPDYDPGHNFQSAVINEPFFIFGGSPSLTAKVVEIFARIAGPCKTYMQCTAGEAEIIKYMDNSFLGAKVIFTYEMKQICDAFGEDFFKVREGWLLDPRINRSHTIVFEDHDYPFGGKCLPKDINAIAKASGNAGYSPRFIEEIIHSNNRLAIIRRTLKEKDS